MHDPIRFLSIWSPAFVEDEGFSHTYEFEFLIHGLVSAGCLPKPGYGCSIRPRPCRILLIFVTEEVPLILLFISDSAALCTSFIKIYHMFEESYARSVLHTITVQKTETLVRLEEI